MGAPQYNHCSASDRWIDPYIYTVLWYAVLWSGSAPHNPIFVLYVVFGFPFECQMFFLPQFRLDDLRSSGSSVDWTGRIFFFCIAWGWGL